MSTLAMPASWQSFVADEKLSDTQAEQFKQYLQLLIERSKQFNLTAVTDPGEIVDRHFRDALSLRPFLADYAAPTIADVGTGAGIPGIPLKIAMPEMHLILIEVNKKKIAFLQEVVNLLGLENVEIYPHDWRTFIRKTSYPVDLFVARASLQPQELTRIFSPSCPYNNAQLAYFASRHWSPDADLSKFVTNQQSYQVGGTVRQVIFFSRKLPS